MTAEVPPWQDDLVIIPATTATRVTTVLATVADRLHTLDPDTAVLVGEVLTAHARMTTAIAAADYRSQHPLRSCSGCCLHSGSPT